MGTVPSSRVASLYELARALQGEDRRAFLQSACDDNNLREAVEARLAADENRDSARGSLGVQPGSRFGNYRVEHTLGRGGTGTVFLAHDTVLHRKVALKLLATRGDPAAMRGRLLHEARSVARLNHPNVCAVYEMGSIDDAAFIAMEYIDGRSLQDILRQGPLELDRILSLAVQAADALAHAHSQGVVHRDFKAANAMVTSAGVLKVVDFGLARRADRLLAEETTIQSIVPEGTIAGTPYAMAPEQIQGKPADARTDVWALGVLLYEMAARRRPFSGATVYALLMSIERDPPEPLGATVPAALRAIIERCLEKSPDRRYGRASDARAALATQRDLLAAADQVLTNTRVATWRPTVQQIVISMACLVSVALALLFGKPQTNSGPSDGYQSADVARNMVSPRRAVAILGFANITNRPDMSYVSTAVERGLGSELGTPLRIVADEDILQLRQSLALSLGQTLGSDTLGRIREALAADVVVIGSYTVTDADNTKNIRLDVRVQETDSGRVINASSFIGAESELLQLISECGATIRAALGLTGSEATPRSNTALPTVTDARQLYAEALDALSRFDAKGARDLFERSIAQQPDFALAHVGLANAWAVLGYDQQAAREAATARELSTAMSMRDRTWIEGLYREYKREWASAVQEFQALVTQYPDQSEYSLKLAETQIASSLTSDALITLSNLERFLPSARNDPNVLLSRATAAESLGDARELERWSRRAIDAADRKGARLLVARASIGLARAQQLLGDFSGARTTNENARKIFEDVGDRRGVARALIQLGTLALRRSAFEEARKTLQMALDISRELGTKRQISQALNELANVSFRQRRFAEAAVMYEEAVAVSRELGDQGAEARALGNLASVRYEQGDVAAAQRLDQQALAVKRRIGDQRSIAISLLNIAETAADLGDLEGAETMYGESITIFEKLGSKSLLASSLMGLATVSVRRDQLPLAQSQVERAVAIRKEISESEALLDSEIRLAGILLERGNLAAAEQTIERLEIPLKTAPPEVAAHAAILRATLSLRDGSFQVGQRAVDEAMQRSKEGYGAATTVALQLVSARLQGAAGARTAGVSAAREVMNHSRMRGLRAFELEAGLAVAEITRDQRLATDVAHRATSAKFALVARKASRLPAITD